MQNRYQVHSDKYVNLKRINLPRSPGYGDTGARTLPGVLIDLGEATRANGVQVDAEAQCSDCMVGGIVGTTHVAAQARRSIM